MASIRKLVGCLATLALALGAPHVSAQVEDFPRKPLKIIVPFTPGGPTDTLARIVGERLTESLKQPVVIENRPGAGGNVGLGVAAQAPADGYTMAVVATSTYAVNPWLHAKLPWDPNKDFVPVALIAKIANVLLVNPEVPAKDLKSLAALMKAKPGELNSGYPGAGNTSHLALAMLERLVGAPVLHVPFKGDAEGMQALLANQIQLYFTVSFVAAPQIKAGKLRPIALAAPVRSPALPDVPTFAEAGMPDMFDSTAWFGLVTNAGTPPAIVKKLNEEVNRALESPRMRDYLRVIGAIPGGGTAAEFAEFTRAERARWGQAVKEVGVKVE
jgi:tripartite-type tricarboxylate transporter receptor subunit TctC